MQSRLASIRRARTSKALGPSKKAYVLTQADRSAEPSNSSYVRDQLFDEGIAEGIDVLRNHDESAEATDAACPRRRG